jgi:prevent-host-death family protein
MNPKRISSESNDGGSRSQANTAEPERSFSDPDGIRHDRFEEVRRWHEGEFIARWVCRAALLRSALVQARVRASLPSCTQRCTFDGMAKRYSIADARSNLPSIVDQAEAGQEIELTRRGKPVAVIVSLRELERLRGERVPFAEAYRRFLKEHTLRELSVEEDVFATTRDRGPGRKVSL